MGKLGKRQKQVIFIASAIAVIAVSGILVRGSMKRQDEINRSVEIGNRYLSELNYDEAIACFQEVLEIDPKNSVASFSLADAYQGKGMYVYAESIYQDLIKDDEKNAEAYINLAELYIKEEKLEEAKELLEEAKQKMQDESIDDMYKFLNPSAPTASHEPGVYTERIRLALLSEDQSQTIYYTLDGTEPTRESSQYTKPLILRNGVTTIKAMVVNVMGYQSSVVEFTYDTQIADVEITVEEPAIERLIRDYLNLSYREPIYNDDIEQITEIYLISNYLIAAENQYSVSFEQNQYSVNGYSMTPYSQGAVLTLNDLKYMPFLEVVAVEYQPQLDISALTYCTSIKQLSLMGDNLDNQDIEALSSLIHLEKLNLGWNEINDLTAVAGLTDLTHLGVWGNQITNLSPVTSCKNLVYLDFADNKVADISMLPQLENIEQLWMYQNQVADISPVADMANLHVLIVRDNPISNPESVRPIYAHLTRLDVDLLNLGAGAE